MSIPCLTVLGLELGGYIVHPTGFVLNLMCVGFWAQVIWRRKSDAGESNMFKYLLVKSICDLFIFSNTLVSLISEFDNSMTLTWAFADWEAYFLQDTVDVVKEISCVFEVLATLDCFLCITKRLPIAITKKAFYVISACGILFCLAFEFFWYFTNFPDVVYSTKKINSSMVGNVTQYTYDSYPVASFVGSTDFGITKVATGLTIAQFLFRDVFLCAVLLVLNMLIFLQIRQMAKRRVHMAGSAEGDSRSRKLVIKALKAERKKSIMMVLTGVNYILLHLPYSIFYMNFTFDFMSIFVPGNIWFCYDFITTALDYFAFANAFFFYYFFNTQFNKVANKDFKYMFYPVWLIYRALRGKSVRPDRDESTNSSASANTAPKQTAQTTHL